MSIGDKKTYSLILYCVNCYNKFPFDFPVGHECEESGFGNTHFIREPNEDYTYIKCPNCGCSNIRKVFKQLGKEVE